MWLMSVAGHRFSKMYLAERKTNNFEPFHISSVKCFKILYCIIKLVNNFYDDYACEKGKQNLKGKDLRRDTKHNKLLTKLMIKVFRFGAE